MQVTVTAAPWQRCRDHAHSGGRRRPETVHARPRRG